MPDLTNGTAIALQLPYTFPSDGYIVGHHVGGWRGLTLNDKQVIWVYTIVNSNYSAIISGYVKKGDILAASSGSFADKRNIVFYTLRVD